jgi:hypothetical protein
MTAIPKTLLKERYKLLGEPLADDQASLTCLGLGAYDTEYLIKLWPFRSGSPDDFVRALWDSELRTMYRVGSSPGAEDTVLVIRDAGLDSHSRCFVMVLEAMGSNGYTAVSQALRHRADFAWLILQRQVSLGVGGGFGETCGGPQERL